MDTNQAAPDLGEVMPAPVVNPAAESTPISVQEAARQMSQWRAERNKPQEPVKAEPAPAEQNLAETPENSAPPQEVPAETTEAPEPAEEPTIEPPRSWTKDEKERFQTLPRETQEYIAQREQEREREIRRSQNEAAEKLKGLTAKEQAAEQERQKYEQALPALLHTLHQEMLGEFSDIKTMEDLQKLASDDPFRFAKYQAKQMQVASIQNEVKQTQERQAQEYRSKWEDFAKAEDAKFVERLPDMADPDKAKQISEAAVSVLHDHGFTDQELAKLWGGEASISLRDHRLQLLIHDSIKLREARKNAAKPLPKPVPNVQRPGTPPPKGAADAARVDRARQNLSNAKGMAAVTAGLELLKAQRANRS